MRSTLHSFIHLYHPSFDYTVIKRSRNNKRLRVLYAVKIRAESGSQVQPLDILKYGVCDKPETTASPTEKPAGGGQVVEFGRKGRAFESFHCRLISPFRSGRDPLPEKRCTLLVR